MSKKTIGILYILSMFIGIATLIVFFALFTSVGVSLSETTAGLQNESTPAPESQTNYYRSGHQMTLDGREIFVIGTGFVVAGILAVIAWIGTLANLARIHLWSWFILTFFFGGIMILVYLLTNFKSVQQPTQSNPTTMQGF